MRPTVGLTVLALLAATPPAYTQSYQRTTPEQERAKAHYRAGWELIRAENFEEAARRFQLAIDLDPKMALAHYGLGRADVSRHRFVEAIKAYTTCRDLYLTRASDRYNTGVAANRAREDELMDLQELQRQSASGPQTQNSANTQRLIQNRIRTVQENLNRGRTLELELSVPAFVSLALGSAYFRAQRFEDAEREYKAAIAADRSVAEAHNNLAVLYMLTGRFDDSEREIKLAEKGGFQVNADFKHDLAERRAKP